MRKRREKSPPDIIIMHTACKTIMALFTGAVLSTHTRAPWVIAEWLHRERDHKNDLSWRKRNSLCTTIQTQQVLLQCTHTQPSFPWYMYCTHLLSPARWDREHQARFSHMAPQHTLCVYNNEGGLSVSLPLPLSLLRTHGSFNASSSSTHTKSEPMQASLSLHLSLSLQGSP